jgi:type IV pilus assembly protein PilW
MRRHLRTRGFTLVEVMIAIAIGLFLTTVIANLFINSRTAYNTTDEISRMQENMRFAYELLTRTVRVAGYRSSPNSSATGDFGVFIPRPVPPGDIAINGTDDDVNGSDTLTIRYQGSGVPADGTIVDCSGREIVATDIVTNVFSIRQGQNGNLALFCDRSIVGAPEVIQVEIVPDVQAMHIRYGEDTSSPNDAAADRYVAQPDVGNMNTVVAIRVALLFHTANAGGRNDLDTRVYDMNGVAVGPFNDTRVRRLVTWNLNLRNRTP